MSRSLYGDSGHPNIAATLHQLGVVSGQAGDLEKAKEQLEESLRMNRSLHGDNDHPGIAVTLHELGGVSTRAGDLEQAKRQLEESLRIACSLDGNRDRRDIAAAILHVLGEIKAHSNRDRDHPGIAVSPATARAFGQYLASLGTKQAAGFLCCLSCFWPCQVFVVGCPSMWDLYGFVDLYHHEKMKNHQSSRTR